MNGECHGEQEPGLYDVFDHDPGIGLDFSEDTLVWVVGPIWAVHRKNPPATGLELEQLEGVGEAVGSPPTSEAVRLREGRKYFCGSKDITRSVRRAAFELVIRDVDFIEAGRAEIAFMAC